MRDDRRHPSLARAHALGQRRLDDLARRDRDHYGATHVQEVHVQTALQPFVQQGDAWSLNPYLGCAHRCSYCYVPDIIQAERHRWGTYVIVKRNVATVLAKELPRRQPKRVYLCTGTDPYQPAEAEHRITRGCLDRLVRRRWPVDVLTRSPLVLRDTDLLAETDHRVGLSVPTMDDAARAVVEPAAPPIDARLDALRRLADAGLVTYANLAPAYPPSGGFTAEDVAQTFAETGVGWVNFSAWRRRRTVLPVVSAKTAGTPYADLARIVAVDEQQDALEQQMQAAFDAIGLPLRRGFFNPPDPPS